MAKELQKREQEELRRALSFKSATLLCSSFVPFWVRVAIPGCRTELIPFYLRGYVANAK